MVALVMEEAAQDTDPVEAAFKWWWKDIPVDKQIATLEYWMQPENAPRSPFTPQAMRENWRRINRLLSRWGEATYSMHIREEPVQVSTVAWWKNMSLDEQKRVLIQQNPETDPHSTFTPQEWAWHWRRINQEINDSWLNRERYLRRRCWCGWCTKCRPVFYPQYYVPRLMSYECFLERREEDREAAWQGDPSMMEEISALEERRAQRGSVVLPLPPLMKKRVRH